MPASGLEADCLARLRSLFESKKYADVTIFCGDREFHVHKCIVCAPDSVLEKMFDTPMKESATGEVRFEEVSAEIIEAILKSLYGLPYDVPDDYEAATIFYAEVYAKAAELDLPKVKDHAFTQFDGASSTDSVTGAKRCLLAAETVYTTTMDNDRRLRDVVVEVVNNHMKALIDEDGKGQAILQAIPSLSYDLVCKRAANDRPTSHMEKDDEDDPWALQNSAAARKTKKFKKSWQYRNSALDWD